MNDGLPVAMSLHYVVAGYLLVIGLISAGVALVARKSHNRNTYIGVSVLGFSAAGFQYCSALYYQADSIAVAATLASWQVDFASMALLAVCMAVAYDLHPQSMSVWHWLGGLLLLLLMIGTNHATPYSVHSAENISHVTFDSPAWHSLRFLDGEPGLAFWIWLGLAGLQLVYLLYASLLLWRHVGASHAVVVMVYVILQLAALLDWALIDLGLRQGMYLNGYVFALFALMATYRMTTEAAQRSQMLTLRERQMHGEIVHRRRAEDKLRRLSQVFMQAAVPTHIVDIDGVTRQVNEASLQFLRRDVSVQPKVNFLNVLELLGESRAGLLSGLRPGEVREFGPYYFGAGKAAENLYLIKDAWLSFTVSPIFNEDRHLEELVIQLEDVTEKQFVANAISTISMTLSAEAGHAFFKKIAVYLARLLGCKFLFIGLQKFQNGRNCFETLAAADEGVLIENFSFELSETLTERVLRHGTYVIARDLPGQYTPKNASFEFAAKSFLGAAIEDEHKRNIGALIVMDVKPLEHIRQTQELISIFVSRASTELQRLEKEETIRRMAFEDQLTGLPNRAFLQDYVQELFSTGAVQTSAFIQIDLDHFKTINDALGHDVGDDVLCILGKRLMKDMEPNMVVARIGGDEFAVVINGLDVNAEDKKAAMDNLDRIASRLGRLMEKPVQVGDHLLDVGCTMGVVLFPDSARSVIDVFRSADTALYRAKNSGRGSYKIFTPAMREVVNNRLRIEKGLRAALQNNEFLLYYQPQVDLHGNLLGAEALIRWNHSEHGVVSPYIFIPVAEESGLINPIGQWVLQQALAHRRLWMQGQTPFIGRLSINVSPWQFARPDFVAVITDAISQSEIPPACMALEITESAVLSDIKETIDKLTQLREFGLSIALDDFGTGYSSLAYLRDLPLDRLKIDKTFVDALETKPHEPLVESMISIGRHMGLEVVAEGVESSVQLERLINMGCTIYQGYYFARPMAEELFRNWMNSADRSSQKVLARPRDR